jgi:hypothetical protein
MDLIELNGKKFIVESDNKRLLGFFKKDIENDCKREKVEQVETDDEYLICSQGSLKRIVKFARFFGPKL